MINSIRYPIQKLELNYLMTEGKVYGEVWWFRDWSGSRIKLSTGWVRSQIHMWSRLWVEFLEPWPGHLVLEEDHLVHWWGHVSYIPFPLTYLLDPNLYLPSLAPDSDCWQYGTRDQKRSGIVFVKLLQPLQLIDGPLLSLVFRLACLSFLSSHNANRNWIFCQQSFLIGSDMSKLKSWLRTQLLLAIVAMPKCLKNLISMHISRILEYNSCRPVFSRNKHIGVFL